MRVLRVLCCALAIAGCLTPAARADEWNKQTFLTFSGPVQVPGATLPAGTYMFKLADLQSNRHVVQIFDKDGKKIYATILAIPDQRLEPSDKPVVMFAETPAGTPAAVKAWFYPGDTIGDEFVYPKQEAMRIAKATHQPVLSRSDESGEMKSAEVARIDENGNPVKAGENASAASTSNPNKPATGTAGATTTTGTTAPTGTAGTTGTTAGRPAAQNPPAQSPSSNQRATPNSQNQTPSTTAANEPPAGSKRLPRTASPLALYELASALAFAGAFGVRRLRSRR